MTIFIAKKENNNYFDCLPCLMFRIILYQHFFTLFNNIVVPVEYYRYTFTVYVYADISDGTVDFNN